MRTVQGKGTEGLERKGPWTVSLISWTCPRRLKTRKGQLGYRGEANARVSGVEGGAGREGMEQGVLTLLS